MENTDNYKMDYRSQLVSPRAPTNTPVVMYYTRRNPAFCRFAAHARVAETSIYQQIVNRNNLVAPMNIAKVYPTAKHDGDFQKCDRDMNTNVTFFQDEQTHVRSTQSLQEIVNRHKARQAGNGLEAIVGKAKYSGDLTQLAIDLRKNTRKRKPINKFTVSSKEAARQIDAVVNRQRQMSKERMAEVATILGVEGKSNGNKAAVFPKPIVTRKTADRSKESAKLCTPEKMVARHKKKSKRKPQRLAELGDTFCIEGKGNVGLRKLPPTEHTKLNQR